MEILYILLVLLAITRVFGELAVRVGQPALVGELISGICLGLLVRMQPEWFPTLSTLEHDEVFHAITDLGVFFLMLLAGLDMRPRDLAEASGKSLVVACSGLIVPLACGFGLAWLFLPDSEVKLAQATFVGTALAITAVPVAVRVLMDLGQLDTPAGKMVVSAAIFDDVLSLFILAVLVALINTGKLLGIEQLTWLAGQILLFFAVTITIGKYVLPFLGQWIRKLLSDELEFSFLLVVALAFAVLAEYLQLHFILGAFVAGLFFGRQTVKRKKYEGVKQRVSGVTTGFLAPIFFASIGFHLRLDAVAAVPLFLGLLILLAVLSKLAGAGLPAYAMGMGAKASAAIGVAMSARGAVELIIADIALEAGLFDEPESSPVVQSLFSAIVIVAVLTTLAVPILLRFLVPFHEKPKRR